LPENLASGHTNNGQGLADAASRRLLTVGVSPLQPTSLAEKVAHPHAESPVDRLVNNPAWDNEPVDKQLQSAIAQELLGMEDTQFTLASAVECAFMLALQQSEEFDVLGWLESTIEASPNNFGNDPKKYLLDKLPNKKRPSEPRMKPRKSAERRTKGRKA
jgi:hypothetical protein